MDDLAVERPSQHRKDYQDSPDVKQPLRMNGDQVALPLLWYQMLMGLDFFFAIFTVLFVMVHGRPLHKVSGMRPFYYPSEKQKCIDSQCHS